MLTYFRLFSGGNLISFCILTLTISAGVPTSPPAAPAPAAINTFIVKEIGSPFGETVCFDTLNKLITIKE